MPRFWLMKSEPDVYGWDHLMREGEGTWDGVRNYRARNNLAGMEVGEQAFFYHSNIGKEIVGICKVSALAHPDPSDDTGKWQCVDVVAVADLPKPVTLEDAKATPSLSKMSLVTTTRLSVQPVTPEEWRVVCKMGGLDPKKL